MALRAFYGVKLCSFLHAGRAFLWCAVVRFAHMQAICFAPVPERIDLHPEAFRELPASRCSFADTERQCLHARKSNLSIEPVPIAR